MGMGATAQNCSFDKCKTSQRPNKQIIIYLQRHMGPDTNPETNMSNKAWTEIVTSVFILNVLSGVKDDIIKM